MPYNEAKQIADKIYIWLGNGARKRFDEYDDGRLRWELSNSEYRIVVIYGINDDKYALRIEGFPKSKEFDPQLRFYSPASIINKTGSRKTRWELTGVDNDFPKLADYVYSYEEWDSNSCLNWDDMTIAETECIVQKIVDSFQGEYWLHCELREREFGWKLRGEIGGKYRDILVSLKRPAGSDPDNFAYFASVNLYK